MRFSVPTVAALWIWLAAPALAGQGPVADGAVATTTPGIDLAQLPVNVSRIGRQLRQAEVREERDGLKLHYRIEVFGTTPPLKLITPLDNLLTGDVPGTAPTHNDMIRMMTPLEFSAPVIPIVSAPRRK
jgi:hypothetical protein